MALSLLISEFMFPNIYQLNTNDFFYQKDSGISYLCILKKWILWLLSLQKWFSSLVFMRLCLAIALYRQISNPWRVGRMYWGLLWRYTVRFTTKSNRICHIAFYSQRTYDGRIWKTNIVKGLSDMGPQILSNISEVGR